jgi:hypothetical protein
MSLTEKKKHQIGSGLVFLSFLVGLDLVSSAICFSLPLLFYLVAGMLGALFGGFSARWFVGEGRLKKQVRIAGFVVITAGVCGAAYKTVTPPNWDSHCGYTECGRVLGPGILQSPYPVGIPPCNVLNRCINEYPFNNREYHAFYDLIGEVGCPPP